MANTLVFLNENKLMDYNELVRQTDDSVRKFAEISKNIKSVETRMTEISELQEQIGGYSKTRDIYAQYKASGWNRNFYESHQSDIIRHKAAKKYFDSLGYGKDKKLPSINQLKQEYAVLKSEKGKLYRKYKSERERKQRLVTAKHNTDRILHITPEKTEQRTMGFGR